MLYKKKSFKKISVKASLLSLSILSCAIFASSHVLAIGDYCTPQLNTYLKGLQATVDSKYISKRQKEAAQEVLDKVKASRNARHDCILLNKLLP